MSKNEDLSLALRRVDRQLSKTEKDLLGIVAGNPSAEAVVRRKFGELRAAVSGRPHLTVVGDDK
jgi:hypothetical protein